MSLDEIELAAITRMLALTGGNQREAARRLRITRKTLYQKLTRGQGDEDVAPST